MITIAGNRHDGDRWNEVDFSDLLALLVLESHNLETYHQSSFLSQATMIEIWVNRLVNRDKHNEDLIQARHNEWI